VKHRYRFGIAVAVVVLGLFMEVFGACRTLTQDSSIFTLDRGVGHFSFHYSTRYSVGKVEVKKDYTDVVLDGPSPGKDKAATWIFIFINSYSGSGREPDPGTEIERSIEIYATENTYPDLADFRLIDRSSTSVGGMPAEQIVYFHNAPPTIAESSRGLGWKPILTREVYFASGDFLWKLTLSYQQTTSTADDVFEADFGRVLETFRILD
jgi:hypothetical protein